MLPFILTALVVVFFHIRTLSIPTVPADERFNVLRVSSGEGADAYFPNFFRVTVRHGYNDRVITNDLGLFIHENIRDYIIHEGAGLSPRASFESQAEIVTSQPTDQPGDEKAIQIKTVKAQQRLQQELVRESLETLQTAYEEQVVHIVGKEQMRIDVVVNVGGYVRKILLSAFLWLRSNTGTKVANMNLDIEKVVEVGFVKTI